MVSMNGILFRTYELDQLQLDKSNMTKFPPGRLLELLEKLKGRFPDSLYSYKSIITELNTLQHTLWPYRNSADNTIIESAVQSIKKLIIN